MSNEMLGQRGRPLTTPVTFFIPVNVYGAVKDRARREGLTLSAWLKAATVNALLQPTEAASHDKRGC